MNEPAAAQALDDRAPGQPTEHPNQFSLLSQRRFAPFFWTQFSGAANDNLFKFALTVMVTYQLSVSWLPPALAGLVIGALFILPFLLFSATSGQLSDKYDKTRMIRLVKNLEIVIMLVAAYGFLAHDVVTLLACIFLMGLHSTLFGPVKYALLPQVLSERELTGGNGMVEMGTFVAILLGNLAGGLIVTAPSYRDYQLPEMQADIDKYLQGVKEVSAENRLRMFDLIRRITSSDLETICLHGEGSPMAERMTIFMEAGKVLAGCRQLVEEMAQIKN